MPFFHLRVAQTAIYRRKWQTTAAALPPVINGRQSRPAHSRIFPHCYAMRFALRANGKNAAIIANAIMSPLFAAMDSRSRENDGDIKSPSSQMALCACSLPCSELIPACAGMTRLSGNDGNSGNGGEDGECQGLGNTRKGSKGSERECRFFPVLRFARRV